MGQITSGIRAILSNAFIYQFVQDLLGKKNRGIFFETYVKARPGDTVLDVGCGTGNSLEYLPQNVQYIGIDLSSEYIENAKIKYGGKGNFLCCDVTEIDFTKISRPDIILAKGILHHLSDHGVSRLLKGISGIMNLGSRLITIDPCYSHHQNILAKLIMSMDRGQNIRTADEYRSLASGHFESVKVDVMDHLLRVPYTHCIMQCRMKNDAADVPLFDFSAINKKR